MTFGLKNTERQASKNESKKDKSKERYKIFKTNKERIKKKTNGIE